MMAVTRFTLTPDELEKLEPVAQMALNAFDNPEEWEQYSKEYRHFIQPNVLLDATGLNRFINFMSTLIHRCESLSHAEHWTWAGEHAEGYAQSYKVLVERLTAIYNETIQVKGNNQ